jgi:hypothetical protein
MVAFNVLFSRCTAAVIKVVVYVYVVAPGAGLRSFRTPHLNGPSRKPG